MHRLLLSVLFAAALAAPSWAAFSFSLNKSAYGAGENIVATWSDRSPAYGADWIGIYRQGQTPGGVGSTLWFYVNGTRTAGSTGVTAGSVTFASPTLAAGTWVAYFLQNDGYTVVGSPITFTVAGGGGGRTMTSFALNKALYLPGEAITATWTGLTQPSATDWVGIYPRSLSGEPDGNPASTIWQYIPTVTANGSLTFDNPGLPNGSWRAYFLLNDGYQYLRTFDFEVGYPPIVAFGADHLFLDDGPVVTLSWVLNPGPGGVQTLTVTDGTTTFPVANVDTLDVTPTGTTTYTLNLNGTLTDSVTVYRSTGNTPGFSLGSSAFSANEPVAVTWNGASSNAQAWVGIYREGDEPGPTPAFRWAYLNGTGSGAGAPDGTRTFDLPTGSYFAILFTDGGYTVDEGPIRFRVADGPIVALAVDQMVIDDGDLRVRWNSVPGRLYAIYTTTNLADPASWTAHLTGIRATGVLTERHLDRTALPDRVFLRVYEIAEPVP